MTTRFEKVLRVEIRKHYWTHFIAHFFVCRILYRIRRREYTEYSPKKWRANFDSDQYWAERGATYREEFKKKRLFNKFQFWIQERYSDAALKLVGRKIEVRRILDAGCGFGRITARLCRRFPYAYIEAWDISLDQLVELKQEMPRVITRHRSISTKFIESPPQFDVTTVSEVLMHITAGNIEAAIYVLTSYTKRFIVTVDWWTTDEVDIWAAEEAGFCFLHDYRELFEAQGFRLYSFLKIPFVKQRIRIWERMKK